MNSQLFSVPQSISPQICTKKFATLNLNFKWGSFCRFGTTARLSIGKRRLSLNWPTFLMEFGTFFGWATKGLPCILKFIWWNSAGLFWRLGVGNDVRRQKFEKWRRDRTLPIVHGKRNAIFRITFPSILHIRPLFSHFVKKRGGGCRSGKSCKTLMREEGEESVGGSHPYYTIWETHRERKERENWFFLLLLLLLLFHLFLDAKFGGRFAKVNNFPIFYKKLVFESYF